MEGVSGRGRAVLCIRISVVVLGKGREGDLIDGCGCEAGFMYAEGHQNRGFGMDSRKWFDRFVCNSNKPSTSSMLEQA